MKKNVLVLVNWFCMHTFFNTRGKGDEGSGLEGPRGEGEQRDGRRESGKKGEREYETER